MCTGMILRFPLMGADFGFSMRHRCILAAHSSLNEPAPRQIVKHKVIELESEEDSESSAASVRQQLRALYDPVGTASSGREQGSIAVRQRLRKPKSTNEEHAARPTGTNPEPYIREIASVHRTVEDKSRIRDSKAPEQFQTMGQLAEAPCRAAEFAKQLRRSRGERRSRRRLFRHREDRGDRPSGRGR
jgi:hypothetical protein